MPKALLKNRRAASTKDYDSPIHQSLWTDMKRYLHFHRNCLMRFPTDLVFVARTQIFAADADKPPKTHEEAEADARKANLELMRRVSRLTKRYLWRCDGIGSHGFRYIVGTSILKTDGGDIKTAALVLHDQEETVAKHYAWLRSGDGSVRMGKLLGKTLNRM